jgi:hypothetical protein
MSQGTLRTKKMRGKNTASVRTRNVDLEDPRIRNKVLKARPEVAAALHHSGAAVSHVQLEVLEVVSGEDLLPT